MIINAFATNSGSKTAEFHACSVANFLPVSAYVAQFWNKSLVRFACASHFENRSVVSESLIVEWNLFSRDGIDVIDVITIRNVRLNYLMRWCSSVKQYFRFCVIRWQNPSSFLVD